MRRNIKDRKDKSQSILSAAIVHKERESNVYILKAQTHLLLSYLCIQYKFQYTNSI